MKETDQVSTLMLEQYLLGELPAKSRKLVEEALVWDIQLASRYEEIKKSNEEIQSAYPLESLPQLAPFRNAVVQLPTTGRSAPDKPKRNAFIRSQPRRKQLVWGLCAAAVIVCVFFSVFFYLKGSGPVEENVIAAEPDTETVIPENTISGDPVDNTENAVPPAEKVNPRKDESETTVKPVPKTGETTETRQRGIANETIIEENTDFQHEETAIAAVPETETGIYSRGSNSAEPQVDAVTPPKQETTITIPPFLTVIIENMFADRQLSTVVIPDRITSIAKNAFSGNPLVSVTIGAGVDVDDRAFPGNFADVYNNSGRAAGTYTRPNTAGAWKKN